MCACACAWWDKFSVRHPALDDISPCSAAWAAATTTPQTIMKKICSGEQSCQSSLIVLARVVTLARPFAGLLV